MPNTSRKNCHIATEYEFPLEFARKSFHPTFLYRLPSDENLCYTFRMAGLSELKIKPFLCCSTCERVYAQSRKENKPRQHVIKRNFNNTYMRDDPTLRHVEGCQPRLYSKAVEKLEIVETSNVGKKRQEGFPLAKLQKYVYSVIHRIPSDPSMCLRFLVIHKAVTHLRLQCDKCTRIGNNQVCQAHLCTPTSFTTDPTTGHLKGCAPIEYKKIIEENEMISKEMAEKLMFERRPVGVLKDDISMETIQTPSNKDHSNASQINVIELRQKVQYIYRTPEDDTKCYRFLTRLVRKSHIDLICSSCDLMNRKHEQRRGNADMSYKYDGHGMLEDPTLRHFPECKPELYDKAINGCRLLETQSNKSGNFPLERIMLKGARNLMYTLPSDNTKCYHFQFEKLTSVFCAPCYQSCRREGKTDQLLYRFTGSQFLDDPLLNHLPACKPMLTMALQNKYQIVEKDAANDFLKTISSQFENIGASSIGAPSEIHKPRTDSEFPVHIVERKNTAISYLFRMDNDKCYRFTVKSINSSYSMQCATCAVKQRRDPSYIKNQAYKVIGRETDGFSMKMDPCLNHCDGCEPLSYSEVLKGFQHLKTKSDYENKYEFRLELIEKRRQLNAIYILPEDPTNCYRFFYKLNQNSNSIAHWACIVCSNIYWHGKAAGERPAAYQCSLDGFSGDPRSNHLSGCQPLFYSDVMKKFDFVDAARAENLFNHPVNVHMNDIHPNISPKSNKKSTKRIHETSEVSKTHNDDLENSIVLRARKTIATTENSKKPENDLPNLTKWDEQETAKKLAEKQKGIRQFLRSSKTNNINVPNLHEEITEPLDQGLVTHSEQTVEDDIVQDHEDADENIKPTVTPAIQNIPTPNANVHIKSEIADPIETKPIPTIARCKSEIFWRMFEIPMFFEDEIAVRLQGRTLLIECRREVSAQGVTGCALSYRTLLPDTVDVSTIETILTAGELYLTATMHQ